MKHLPLRHALFSLLAVLFVSSLLSPFVPSQAFAEKDIFTLELRVIKATQPVGPPLTPAPLDKDLSDLQSSLATLPFTSFTQLKRMTKQVALKQKIGFSLCAGQTLFVRPLYKEAGRIGIWIRWTDGDGAPLLDTRMHIDDKHPILVGNEEVLKQNGRVLALALLPSK